jgi:hypothetical protein
MVVKLVEVWGRKSGAAPRSSLLGVDNNHAVIYAVNMRPIVIDTNVFVAEFS